METHQSGCAEVANLSSWWLVSKGKRFVVRGQFQTSKPVHRIFKLLNVFSIHWLNHTADAWGCKTLCRDLMKVKPRCINLFETTLVIVFFLVICYSPSHCFRRRIEEKMSMGHTWWCYGICRVRDVCSHNDCQTVDFFIFFRSYFTLICFVCRFICLSEFCPFAPRLCDFTFQSPSDPNTNGNKTPSYGRGRCQQLPTPHINLDSLEKGEHNSGKRGTPVWHEDPVLPSFFLEILVSISILTKFSNKKASFYGAGKQNPPPSDQASG